MSLYLLKRMRQDCEQLFELQSSFPSRNIKIEQADANDYLQKLCSTCNWYRTRGVLFLDPFSTQVKWETVEAVANTEALDVWLLFPVHATARMLPTRKDPGRTAVKLNLIFGDESWRELYNLPEQGSFFGEEQKRRASGSDGTIGIIGIYKRKLKQVMGNRLLDKSKKLVNSRNAPLFELIFFTGSPSEKARKVSHGIAQHLLNTI